MSRCHGWQGRAPERMEGFHGPATGGWGGAGAMPGKGAIPAQLEAVHVLAARGAGLKERRRWAGGVLAHTDLGGCKS